MRFSRFQRLNATDSPQCEFSYSYYTNLRYLFHLIRRIVPDSSAKTPRKFQSVPCGNCILEVNLAVDHATDQSVDGREQNRLVLQKLSLVFYILLVRWKVHSAKLRLNYETPFVRVHGNIDFDGELDAVCAVYLFEQFLLADSKTYVTELLCLGNGRELEPLASPSQDC